MDFTFIPYSDDQRKTFVNSELIYKSYLTKKKRFDKSFRYKMGWQKVKGKEYLYKESLDSKIRKSLGLRSLENEKIIQEFTQNKKELKEAIALSKASLQKQEKINKFTKISRVPNVVIDIFRKINELKLDDKVIVIGTNSLYAYEAYCGVFIEEHHLATFDIDILNKRDKKISIAFKEKIPDKTLLGILLDIDKTFEKDSDVPYRFTNKNDVVVELINPLPINQNETDKFVGVIGLELQGIEWVENLRLHKGLVIGDNGKCAFITTVNPLEYAIYKSWLSNQKDRDPIKRDRDLNQSLLVTKLIQEYMPIINIDEDIKKIKHFPNSIISDYKHKVL
ncbi:MAG: GSU2403 family nucleotidyltransferase fold protein [Campylobacterota bacterium]|nr:GSU2403 family nucleotidyltransferase fold protein [Campylobacterota bacterium]